MAISGHSAPTRIAEFRSETLSYETRYDRNSAGVHCFGARHWPADDFLSESVGFEGVSDAGKNAIAKYVTDGLETRSNA